MAGPRRVKLIVTFPPGGASDAAARVISRAAVGEARPDGDGRQQAGRRHDHRRQRRAGRPRTTHTLMLSNSAPISIAPYLFDKPPYDPLKDFAHVAYIGSVANAFVVRPAVPAKTMPELIALDQRPGQGRCRSARAARARSATSSARCSRPSSGSSMEHIGYRGAAPMFQDMMAGQLDFAVVTLTEVLPLAKDGKLRMIALTSTQKAPSAPDVPLVTELGYPKLVAENFVGISAPAGFPAGGAGAPAQGDGRGAGRPQDRRAAGRPRLRHQADDARPSSRAFVAGPGPDLPGAGEGVGTAEAREAWIGAKAPSTRLSEHGRSIGSGAHDMQGPRAASRFAVVVCWNRVDSASFRACTLEDLQARAIEVRWPEPGPCARPPAADPRTRSLAVARDGDTEAINGPLAGAAR